MKILALNLLLLTLISIVACESSIQDPNSEGSVDNEVDNEVKVTYQSDILPIMQSKCNTCHGPNGKLDTYQTAKSNINSIINRINRDSNQPGFMPKGGTKLSTSELNKFNDWLTNGLPEN